MAVSYKLVPVPSYRAIGTTAVTPDLSFNAKYGIVSDFDCGHCNKGIGISWKQGVQPGLIARCPHCGVANEFIREDI